MKYDLRKIMTRAWKNYRKNSGLSFGECLHRAWLTAKAEIENQRRVNDAKAAAGITEQAAGYKDLDRDRLRTKTIFYLFVLDGKARMIDNDNYDTTAVTNSIAGHLYGGDSPLTCRMVYDSVLSDDLPAGTYISVLPASEPLPDKADIAARWKTILEK